MENRGFVETGRFETGSIYTILNRMEKKELLTSEKKEADSGRIRRVYSVTPKGVQVLKEGLIAVKQHAKIVDELTEFYEKTFTETDTSVEDASEM